MSDEEEKNLMEDKDRATGLVDCSASLEDEKSAPSVKRPRDTAPGTGTGTGTGTDDYMTDSGDDNSALPPVASSRVVKMRRGMGPRTDGYLSDDADDENADRMMESFWNSEPFFSDTTPEGSDDEGDNCYYTDTDVLPLQPRDWSAVRKWNLREVYLVYVRGKSPLKRSKCLKLLNVIGCCDRYLGRSVESPRAFFANLNKDEAFKMEDVMGVHHVMPRRFCCYDV